MERSLDRLVTTVFSQQISNLAEFLSCAHEATDKPAEGTPAYVDLEHATDHPTSGDLLGLRWRTHQACLLNVLAGREHLYGLHAVISSEGPTLPFPAMALARSVHEALLNVCWLIDTEVSTEQRFARWAGSLLHDTQEPSRTQALFGSVVDREKRDQFIEARSLGQHLMNRAGFELTSKRGDRSDETANVAYRGVKSNLEPKAAQLTERFIPNHPYLWPMFSAAVHGKGWFLSSSEEPTKEETFGAVVLPLLDTIDALVVETGNYLGLATRPTLKKTNTHRMALFRQIRPDQEEAWPGVDEYRAQSGLPPLA